VEERVEERVEGRRGRRRRVVMEVSEEWRSGRA
jgi:hypothetical protein